MATDPAWAARDEDHRKAVEHLLADLARLDEAGWCLAPAPGKWCPGQIAEHLLLAYEVLLGELEGGRGIRVRATWWLRPLLRWWYLPAILRDGRLPPGAPAVREIRPGGEPRPRELLLTDLEDRASRFADGLSRAFVSGGGRLTHPFFGTLSAPEGLRFVTVHLEHHRRQIPGSSDQHFR